LLAPAVVAIATRPAEGARPAFKVLHVMSYHSPWEWTDEQFRGFRDALQGLDIEYRVLQMAPSGRARRNGRRR
jgi:hypothetical protein